MEMQELIAEMTREGYEYLRVLPFRGLVGIRRFIYTTGICVLTLERITHRWCYPTLNDAWLALNLWTGEGDPDGPWIKYKGIDGEYPNPNKDEVYE